MYRNRLATVVVIALASLAITQAPQPSQPLSSLPGITSGNNVGTLGGEFGVDGNGAATYQIGIDVPPGTNNVEPLLSLTYNSGRDNGFVGMGWALNGIESVSRCNAATVPNGYIAPVNYDSRDRFCSGNMPLLAASGEYGADGTEYRTVRDTWTKFVSHGQCGTGPCWFSAQNKDGATLRFGFTTGDTGSRILASGRTDGAVRIWSQDRYTDLNDNYTEVRYYNNFITAEYYPTEIHYTGNERTGLSPQRSVIFSYGTRNDRVTGYAGGSPFQELHRLDNIKTYVGTQLVTNYALNYTYGASTQRSRVQSIRQCASDTVSDATCLNATTLAMSDPQNGFTGAPSRSTSLSLSKVGGLIPMDINGDGLTDMIVPWNNGNLNFQIFLSNGGGLDPGVNQATTAPMSDFGVIASDVNGDGLGDIVQPYKNGSNVSFRSFISTGTNFGREVVTNTSTNSDHLAFLPADVNADGLEDVVQVVDNGGKVRYVVFLSKGDGSFDSGVVTDTNRSKDNYGFIPLDVNGDGRADIVQPQTKNNSLNFLVEFSTGDRFEEGPSVPTGRNPSKPDIQVADVNGDQKADLILIDPGTTTDEIVPFLSTGTSFRQVLTVTAQGGENNLGIYAFNLNGDGRTDLLQEVKSSGKIKLIPFYSLGDRFQAGSQFSSTVDASTLGLKPAQLTGDGKQDVIVPQDQSGTLNFGMMLALPGQPDLMNDAANGVGGHVSIVMKPLADKSVYTRGNRARYPVMDAINSMPVVAEYTNSNGAASNYRFVYHYLDGRVGYNGIGWLGFERMRMTDTADGRFSEITYDQTWPRNGTVIQSAVFDQNQVMLSQTTSDYKDIASSSLQQKNIHEIVRNADTFSMYDNKSGGAKLYTLKKTFDYDSTGNVNFIGDLSNPNVVEDDLFTCVRFRNDPATWRLGYIEEEMLAKTEASCRAFITTSAPSWDPVNDIHWTKKTYDARMNVASEQNYDDSTGKWLAMSFTSDDYGNRKTITDAGNNTTTITFDDTYQTFPVRVVSPPDKQGNSLTELYKYNPYFGTQEENTDPNNNVFKWSADDYGRVVDEYGPNPSGAETRTHHVTFRLESNGYSVEEATRPAWSSTDDPTAWQWERTYVDGLQREYKTVSRGVSDDKNVVEESRYNDQGQVSETSTPHFASETPSWIISKYDVYNRPTSTTQPDGTEERLDYELGTLKVASTAAYGSPEAQTEIDNLDIHGQIISRILPNGAVYRYTYTRAGQLININTLPDRRTLDFTYDSIGRLRSFASSNSGKTTYHFNDAGLMSGSTDADNNSVSYEYDGLGRVTKTTNVAGSITKVTDLTYDGPTTNGRGNITRVTMNRPPVGDMIYDLGYDPYQQTKSVRVDLGDRVFSYGMEYNPSGQVTDQLYPDGTTLITGFGTDLNPVSQTLRDQTGGEQRYVTYADYNPYGTPLSMTLKNGVQSNRTFYPENVATAKVKTITARNAAGSLYGREIHWNRLDAVTKLVDLNGTPGTETLEYDAKKMGYLAKAEGPFPTKKYGYNSVGDRSTFDETTYTYAPSTDKLLTWGTGNSATWNTNGTLKTLTTGGATITFTYDAEGRITEAARSDMPSDPAKYVYDFAGNLAYGQTPGGNVKNYKPSSDFEVADYGGTKVLNTKYIEGMFGPAVAITTDANAPRQSAGKSRTNRLIQARLYEGSASSTARLGALFDRLLFFVSNPALAEWIANGTSLLVGIVAFFLSLQIAARTRRRRKQSTSDELTGYSLREPRFAAIAPLVCAFFVIGFIVVPVYADMAPGANGAGNPVVGTLFFVQDITASTVSVTDDNGVSSADVNYTPFGDVNQAASHGTNNFRPKFSGRPYQEGLGLYYFGSRFYDARTGRFTTPDPAQQFVSPYIYAGNDPVSMIDPNGEFAFLIAIVVGALIGAYMGAAAVNHDYNPANWDWKSGKTYAGLFGGAIIGAVGGAVMAVAASAGVAAGIAGAVLVGAGESAAYTAMGGGSAKEILMSALEGAAFGFIFGGAGAGLSRLASKFAKRGAQLAGEAASELADSGAPLLRGGGCASFLAGQEVLNGDDQLQPIETMRVGEKVWGYDQENDAVDRFKVSATVAGDTTEVTRITTGSGNLIETTPAHLFRAYGMGWLRADQISSKLELTDKDGKPVKIRSVETATLATKRPVYNFSVDDAHDYYVSPDKVLVKNVSATCLAAKGISRPGFRKAVKDLVFGRQTIRSGIFKGQIKSGVGNVKMSRMAKVRIGKKNPRNVTAWNLDHVIPYRDLLWAANQTKTLITWKNMIAISNYAPNLRYITMAQNVSHAFEPSMAAGRRGAIALFKKLGFWK
jgi:RHS repeat-associated protein